MRGMVIAEFSWGGKMRVKTKRHSRGSQHRFIERDLELTESTLHEESSLKGEEKLAVNPPFHSELEYEGYREIEDYDNDALSGDVEECRDYGKPLHFKGREMKENSEEEDYWDKQENRK